jgi:hypothetical protein
MPAGLSARRFTWARFVRALVAPLTLGLPPLFWIVEATRRASLTTFGRDQGIFQYVAWAIRRGATDYRDVRDVNGPLTHFIHWVILGLGGADEHRFRVIDLAVSGAVFAFVGACAPGLRSRRPPSAIERLAWGFAGWVVLSGQYLLYRYWDLAQRESFFDWFMLPSVALQIAAQGPAARRHRAPLMAAVGALSVIPWFGKPTYVLFSLAQVAVVVIDDELAPERRRVLLALGLGGSIGAATQIAFLVATGDIRAFAHIQLVDVPAMYRFIWPRAITDTFSEPWRATQAIFALAGATVVAALVCIGEMPQRALLLALVPLCALAGVIAQAKGFPYHFHPVTSAVHVQWLTFAAWTAERARVAQRRWAIVRLAPIAIGSIFALRIATAMEDSPHVGAVWLLWGAGTPEARTTRDYFAHFAEPDFFPYELRQAADYIRLHTAPDDRVQSYGMDPYVLFLARRESATPYIYAYDLDVDSALAGGTGGRPSSAQSERIRAMRDANESDMLARLEASPPAAFVFIDGSPLLSRADAWGDFEAHCGRVADWMRPRFRETARFGHDHVWLRLDRLPTDRVPDEGDPTDEEPRPGAP